MCWAASLGGRLKPHAGLTPADPYKRAISRFWAAYIDDKLPSAVRILIGALEGSKEQAIEQIFTTVQLLEDAFTKCCKGKKFFGGETIGYIDIAFGSWLGWLKAVEKMFGIKFFDGEKLPLLFGWAERFWSNDAVVVIMPQVDMLIEYSKAFEKKN